jgi:magnesium transporter
MRVLDRLDDQALDQLAARGEFFWLDLLGPTAQQLDALGERLGWHPLVVEDAKERRQRPKLERHGDHMLIVFYGVAETRAEDPSLIEVHVVVSGDWVVTIRQRRSAELDDLRKRLAQDSEAPEQFVVYRVLDALTDTFFPVLEKIDEAIDALEDTIVQAPSVEQLQHVFRLKRRLVSLRRVVSPQRDLAARTIEQIADLPGLDPGSRDWFRDVYDHLIRLSDEIDNYRDLLSGTMDVYLSTTSNRLNVVMKQLTLVSTVFLPITALTGFFGMNFGWMVRHIDSLGAFLALGIGLIAVAVVLLMVWFRRERLLD